MDRLSSPILQAPPGVLAEFEGGPAVVVALDMGGIIPWRFGKALNDPVAAHAWY